MTYNLYGLVLALAGAGMLTLMALTGKRFDLRSGAVALMGAVGVPLAWLCARLVYCLVDMGYFVSTISTPSKMLCFWDGGYSLMGAGLGLVLAAWLTAKVLKDSPAGLLDSLFTFLPGFILAERLAESLTTLGLGREVQTEWLRQSAFFAVEDSGGYLCHAVYRYEAVVAAILLAVMVGLAFGCPKARKWPKGDLALIMMTIYGCVQVILESFRDDGHMMWGFVRANQIFAIFLPATALIVFTVRGIRKAGFSWKPVAMWIAAAGSIALGIVKEFDVDISLNLWVDYGVMCLALVIIAATVGVAHAWERRVSKN